MYGSGIALATKVLTREEAQKEKAVICEATCNLI